MNIFAFLTFAKPASLRMRTIMLLLFGGGTVFILLLFGLATLFGIPGTDFEGEYTRSRSNALATMQIVADQQQAGLSGWFDERLGDLKVIAEAPLTQDGAETAAQIVRSRKTAGAESSGVFRAELAREKKLGQLAVQMELLRTAYQQYDAVELLDAETGLTEVSTDRARIGSRHLFADRLLAEVAESGDPKIAFVKPPGDTPPVLLLSAAVKRDDDSKPSGVVVLTISMEMFQQQVLNADKMLGTTGEINLIDMQRTLLTPLRHQLPDGTTAEPLVYRMKSRSDEFAAWGVDSLVEAEDYRGVPVASFVRHLRITPEFSISMVVKRDQRELYAPVRNALLFSLALSAASVALIIVLIGIVARWIGRPLEQMSDVALLIKNGDFTARLSSAGSKEAETVATAFNAMVDHVQRSHLLLEQLVDARTMELKILSERQDAILTAVPDIIMEVDVNRIYTWANSTGLEFFGDDVIGREASYYFEGEQDTYQKTNTLFEGRDKVVYVESWQRRKDGEIRLLAWWCKALVDEQGAVIGTLSSARDITEQKQSERTLRESEHRASEALEFNRAILRTSSIGILTYHADGRCIFANEAAAIITGTNMESLLSRNFHEIKSWQETGVYETALRALDSRVEQALETTAITPLGKHIWLSLNFSAVIVKNEKHLLVFAQDITRRKTSEEALQKRIIALTQPMESGSVTFDELFNIEDVQRLQDEFARATGVASLITRPDGTPLTVPSNFTRLCGEVIRKTEKGCANCFKSDAAIGRYRPDGPSVQACLSGGLWDAGAGITVGGQHIANWLIGQVRDEAMSETKMAEYAREIGVDEAIFMEAFHEVPSMSHRQFEHVAKVLFTLANQLSTTAYQNIQQARFINERKIVEEALQKSEETFRMVFDNAPIGLMLSDKNCVVIDCNQHFAEIFGASRQDYAGVNLLAAFPDSALGQHLLDTLADDGLHHFEGSYTSQLTARELYLSVTSQRATTDHVITIINDITAEMRAEEERARLESQLQQAQKMESVGRLAGGVAHDFNNMLGVILGHAELGLMRLDPDNRVCSNLKEIKAGAERSADLTRQLLAFARKQTVAPKVIDLNETVTSMLKMLQRLIGEDILLTWRPSADLHQIKMDPSQLDQILANLCVNARDAIEDTGRIIIETCNCSLDADYCVVNPEATPGEYVRLAVSDDGKGMDRETMAHIFEPFYTTKEQGKGTGLGLATVYGAVKQNSGFINIYSEPDNGTTFSIYLPRFAGEGACEEAKSAAQAVPRGQETILLVEDEAAILDITAIMLEQQGYTVLRADTPGLATELAREHHGAIHLLMTDVIMPEMNGRDLARNILSLHPGMKRLFMSGYTADVIAHHGVLDDGVHFIQKPFSLSVMAAKVREVLDIN